MKIEALPALADNYIWALTPAGKGTVAVDPGAARPVLNHLERTAASLAAILITHKHADHIAGIEEILAAHPGTEVAAPATEGNGHATRLLAPGDTYTPPGWDAGFAVHATPGHTSGHLTYAGNGAVVCGDALFSCGCGRLFEGDAADLAASMAVFAALDPSLLVCCGHEYTMANIRFARAVDPANEDLANWERDAGELRAAGKPTVPVTLAHERTVNPFMRADHPAIRAAAAAHAGHEPHDTTDTLRILRAWKDSF